MQQWEYCQLFTDFDLRTDNRKRVCRTVIRFFDVGARGGYREEVIYKSKRELEAIQWRETCLISRTTGLRVEGVS